ncbi:LOW QUALITY PROTEIN: hypothetical protein Cgig2_006340 [Carnegiea gigantea]|uniref:Uncharacterized protein n=1 Tax=Carnegiea gigantea TaxID=171969 RepID=A0A9Q1JGB8_9CARY|nr:LOW QUALITY PROTEIN: hypothetical protein Cgig2_006340 [Carnegiea gigantea]
MDKISHVSKLRALKRFLCSLRKPLKLLNRSKYADIYAQQAKTREDLIQFKHNSKKILSMLSFFKKSTKAELCHYQHSTISLIKQQSKVEWIGYGDDCLTVFIAKIKQRKAMTCIFQLKNQNDQGVKGFNAVADIIIGFYKDLLGKQEQHRSKVDPQSNETQEHLFFTCNNATDIWRRALNDWGINLQVERLKQCIKSLKKLKMAR